MMRATLAFLAVLLVAACGKSTDPSSNGAATVTAAKVDSSLPTIPRGAPSGGKERFIDMSWHSLPTDEFQKVQAQIRDLYWSGAVKDEAKLAEDFSPDYRREKDSFKKADLVKTLAPELDADFSAAQKQRAYSVRTDMHIVSIEPYDPQAGGFRIAFVEDTEREGLRIRKDVDRSVTNQEWVIRFIGVPSETSFVVKRNEQDARQVEAALATARAQSSAKVFMAARFDGSIVGSFHDEGSAADVGLFRVDSIAAVDSAGKPVLTVSASELGPAEIRCQSTRKALNLREPVYPVGIDGSGYKSQPYC